MMRKPTREWPFATLALLFLLLAGLTALGCGGSETPAPATDQQDEPASSDQAPGEPAASEQAPGEQVGAEGFESGDTGTLTEGSGEGQDGEAEEESEKAPLKAGGGG